MEIAIIVLPGTDPAGLAIAREAFRLVRARIGSMHGARDTVGMATPVRLLSPDGRSVATADGAMVAVHGALGPDRRPDAIHLPALDLGQDETDAALDALAPVAEWIARAHADGSLVTASGTAVHLLADAGLLAGAPMWAPADLSGSFRHRHPSLRGTAHGAVLDRGRVLASRGIAGDAELMVRLVDRVLSPVMAGWLAQALGLHQIVGGQLSGDPLVADAQVWLGMRYADRPRLGDLAATLAVSEQTLLRRFKAQLGTTPRAYVRRLRIEAAQMQLSHSSRSVAQIAFMVGYDDPKSFREAFRLVTGTSATVFRSERRPRR